MCVTVCIRTGVIGRRLVYGIVAWRGGFPEQCATRTRDANIGRTDVTQHRHRKEVCDGEVGAHQTNGHKNNSTESQKS